MALRASWACGARRYDPGHRTRTSGALSAQLLTHQTAFPMPRALLQKVRQRLDEAGHDAPNGPYVLTEWRPHDHVKLVKNPQFYDAANVKIDEVFFLSDRRRLCGAEAAIAPASSTRTSVSRSRCTSGCKKNIPNEAQQ